MLCSPPSLIFNTNYVIFVCTLEASSVNACFRSEAFANRHATSPSHAILIFLRQLRTYQTLGRSFVTTSFANAQASIAMFSATAEGLVPADNLKNVILFSHVGQTVALLLSFRIFLIVTLLLISA